MVHGRQDVVVLLALDGRILAWNPGAVRMYGWSESGALQMNRSGRIPEGLRREELAKLHELSCVDILAPYCPPRFGNDVSIAEVWVTAVPLRNETERIMLLPRQNGEVRIK